jgi:serine/threonine protein kinase
VESGLIPQESHTGILLAERYQLGDVLENGALCTIYRGQDTILRRPIAVKAISPEHAAVYHAALQATATLTHPAIVATYDAVESGGWLFLVQELVAARPLALYLRNGVPSERALDLAKQLARALAYAHSRNVIHGDLTPSAILVDRRAIVRINNFALPPDRAYFMAITATLPQAGDAQPAPVDAQGTENEWATPAGDVRAVGLLLWQMLSMPAAGTADTSDSSDSSDATDAASEEEETITLKRRFRPDVPDDVCELVRRCTQPNHSRAIKDAETLTLALEMEGRALASERPKLSEQTPPALRAAREAIAQMAAWSVEETLGVLPSWNGPEHISAGHTREADPFAGSAPGQKRANLPERAARTAVETPEAPVGPPRLRLPSRPVEDPLPTPYHQAASAPQWPVRGAASQPPYANRASQGNYASASVTEYAGLPPKTARAGLTMQLVVLIGLALFLIAFLAGFFLPALFGGH